MVIGPTFACRLLFIDHHFFPTKPSRYRDTPNDLTRNIPIDRVFHPISEDLLVVIRDKFNLLFVDCIDSHFCQWFHLYKPLVFNLRLYNSFALITFFDDIFVLIVYAYEKIFCLELLYDFWSGLLYVRTRKFSSNWQELTTPSYDLFDV